VERREGVPNATVEIPRKLRPTPQGSLLFSMQAIRTPPAGKVLNREGLMKFRDAQFMTAREKELTLKAWARFVKALAVGTPQQVKRAFTKRIYHHLTQHCSFIAHYNIHGFFETYFDDPQKTSLFLRQFDGDYGYRSIEYGMTYWHHGGNDVCQEYYDLNQAMCQEVEGCKRHIYTRCRQETTKRLEAQHRRIMAELKELRAA
jgi:hypothetical protein